MVNVDVHSGIVTKVSSALNTLVPREKPGFQALCDITVGDGGILVHCISGWDRTPLFISLLRLSLWADAVIHRSLSPLEILYLTIAYDWFLFG